MRKSYYENILYYIKCRLPHEENAKPKKDDQHEFAVKLKIID